ncbi:hypothetical protein GCM10009867_30640 [Pedococcus aerophilus]|uniref:HPt domain-containing protein n=1 Tax=Pedococcus aerophilus TaxID=436356 RepID=A0ABN3UU53_9MICO
MDEDDPQWPDAALAAMADQLGGEDIVLEVVAVYLECLPERLAAMSADALHSREEMGRAAHSLKSASAQLGLHDLSQSCARLEQLARDDGGADVRAAADDVTLRAQVAQEALTRWSAGRT